MTNTTVSIIIPIYNPGDAIINSLNSAISQNLVNIEIICVNDGSDDDSLSILESYGERDLRIKIINQENAGAGSARNTGISNARGEFILFLDCDDWIEENTCELLYYHAKKLNADLVLFNSLVHKDNGFSELKFLENNCENTVFDYHGIEDKIFNGGLGVIWNKFYNTEFLKNNNIQFPNHKIFNDVEFHIKTMMLSEKITYIDNIFYHYNNTTHSSLQIDNVGKKDSLIFCDVLEDIYNFLNSSELISECKSNYLSFIFTELNVKLYHLQSSLKEDYFLKIKELFEKIEIHPEDFKKIGNESILFYINIINSVDYNDFESTFKKFKHIFTRYDDLDELYPNELYLEILKNNSLFENKFKSNEVFNNIIKNKLEM